MRRILILIAVLAGIYIVYGGAMVWAHRAFIYPFFPEELPIPGYARITVPVDPPVRIAQAEGSGPVILFFMGNAGNLGAFGPWLDMHRQAGRNVIALEYPGGAGLPGAPTEAGLKDAALTVHDWAAEKYPDRPIYIHGYSLGSGLAMHVAAERDVAGVVLEAPYAAICRLMQEAARLPACWMPVDRWNSLELAPNISAPVLILHGDADRVIPVSQSAELKAALPGADYIVFKGGGHADLPTFPGYRESIDRALSEWSGG